MVPGPIDHSRPELGAGGLRCRNRRDARPRRAAPPHHGVRRAAPLAEVVRAAAPAHPDVARVHEHHAQLRIDAYHRAIELLDAREALRADVDVDHATDVLLPLAGPAIYVTFLSDRHWSHNRFVTWSAAA